MAEPMRIVPLPTTADIAAALGCSELEVAELPVLDKADLMMALAEEWMDNPPDHIAGRCRAYHTT